MLNGRYRLEDPVARRGKGEAFEATDLLRGAPCVVRRLPGRLPALDLLLEGRVRHPHLEPVVSAEACESGWILVSEPCPGAPLSTLPPEPATLARAALGVISALEALAELGLHHGGVHAERILVGSSGVRLLDAGLGPCADEAPAYPAPEGRSDTRADLYALGACLYERLAGRRPDLTRPLPLEELAPGVPPELGRAIGELLDADPRQRSELGEVRELLSRFHKASSAHLPPTVEPRFVGRTELLAELDTLAEEASALAAAGRSARDAAPGPPPMVRVHAAPDLGRTRLLREAGARLVARGVTVVAAAGFAGRDPAAPWRALVERAAELGADPARVERARAALGGEATTEEVRRERIARVLLDLAKRAPTITLFDDAHLLDAVGAQVVAHLARAGVAMVLSEVPGDGPSPLSAVLDAPGAFAEAPPRRTLEELDSLQAAELVRSMAPDASEADVERLVGLGGGTPFLLVELTHEWRLGGATPRSVSEAVSARLERATPVARELLATLAVVGRPLSLVTFASLELSARDVARAEATSLGLIEEGEGVLAFRHGIARRVLLESLDEAELEACCARVLDALRDDPHTSAGERARLALQARTPDAVELALAAAREEPEPAALYQAALDLMAPSPERAEIQRLLGEALIPRGDFAEARRALEIAREDLPPDDALAEAQTCLSMARLCAAEGTAHEALSWAGRGRAAVERVGEPTPETRAVEAELFALDASSATQRGDHAGAARLYERARKAVAGDPLHTAQLELRLAGALALALDRTRFEEARQRAEGARDTLRESGDRAGELEAARTLGVIAWYAGDAAESARHFGEALEIAESLANLNLSAGLLNNLGLTAQAQGELTQAEAFLERALDIAERSGQASVTCRAYVNVGRVRRERGDARGAIHHFAQGARVARAAGDPMIESAALSELGHTHLDERRFEAALSALRRSQHLRLTLGDVGRVAESELELGEAWRRIGDVHAALESTARALALQASLGDPDGAAAAVEALEFVAGRPGGPAALLHAARRGPEAPEDAPRSIREGLAKGEALCRLALRTQAAALTGRAGDATQAAHHASEVEAALVALEALEEPAALAPALLDLARSLASEARAVVCAARGRVRDALAEIEATSEGPAGQGLRRGALLLKRAFLHLALGHAAAAREALLAQRASRPSLPPALKERRAVGDALVASALRRMDCDPDPSGALGLSLAEAQATSRRLGDVALTALVAAARADEAVASGSPQEAALERGAARNAASRLVEGLPDSLARGLAHAVAPVPAEDAVPLVIAPDQDALLGMLSRVLSSGLELEPLLGSILDALLDSTGAERAALALRGEGAGPALDVRAARNLPNDLLESGRTPRAILEHVAREGLSVVVGAGSPPQARFAARGKAAGRSVLCVPLLGESGPLGAVYLDHPTRNDCFGAAEQALGAAFAARIAGPLRTTLAREAKVGELSRLAEAYRETARELGDEGSRILVGRSPQIRAIHRLIQRYGSTSAPVTISGESGTGKELVARALHSQSARAELPFVALNCTAVAATLLESELFGVEKGAFTGAERSRKGLFELAHTGTLFLDEVGDMSLEMQAKLLRVLETGELRPVGSRVQVKVDVRIVSATHHDLRALVREGRFREDLLYRLNVLRVELPPLRERREDILLLASHFLDDLAERTGDPPKSLDADASERLLRHSWPGNVRELRNAIERASVLEPGPLITGPRLLLEAPSHPQVNEAGPSTPGRSMAPDYHKTYEFEGIALNRRQQTVLDHLREGVPSITNRDYCGLVEVSERTGLRDLTHLVESGLLVRVGRRKGARYELAPHLRG